MEYVKKWHYTIDETETVPYNKINYEGKPIDIKILYTSPFLYQLTGIKLKAILIWVETFPYCSTSFLQLTLFANARLDRGSTKL